MKRGELRIIGLIIICASSLLKVGMPNAQAQAIKTYEAALHFKNIGQYDEGIYFLQNHRQFGFETLSEDTVNYLIGKFNYYQKDIDNSLSYLSRVNLSSSLFSESYLLTAYQHIYRKEYAIASNILSQDYDLTYPIYNQTRRFLLVGMSLLKRDHDSFEKLKTEQLSDFRELTASYKKIEELSQYIHAQKSKSPFLAGVYSSVIPGLGHIYAGNVGRGAMNLLTIGVFGLQAWESYQRDGLKSPRFILFGTLFSGFYFANIYGSVIGVKLHQQQINDQIDESILVTMHVPLRYLFD